MDYQTLADEFLPQLKQSIPLLKSMGITDFHFDGTELRIQAQLAPNVNDKGTGFAGSLASIATLSGWTLITLHLRAQGRDDAVVVHTSSLEYKRPVTSDFEAIVRLPDEETIADFDLRMQERGRARMELDILLQQDGKDKLIMHGGYVAMPREAS